MSVYRYILFIPQTLRTSGQQSQQKKQRLEGIGRHQLGTAKRDFTDDI